MPREMKDSGIEWIGEIPSRWDLSKLGTLYTERKTKVSDVDYPPLSVTMKGIVPQLATAAKTDAHDDRKLVCVGDFAINSRSDRRGSCGISEYDGSVSLINTVLTPRNTMYPQYYNWLFHTASFADEFYSWGHGIVDDLWTTNWQDMKRIQIPIPPLTEQIAIADFLDDRCADIDYVIAETKTTIEEYKKLKQSVITEAVTKSIRGDRPMKDSGIEWIGEIPSEWEVIPHKYVMHKEKTICEHYSGEDIISLTMNGVIVRDLTAGGKMPTTFDGYQYVEEDDLLLCLFDIDVTPRCVGVVRNNGITSPAYSRFKVHKGFYNCYYDYLLRFIDDEKVFVHLAKNLRSSLTETDFGAIKTVMPSFIEQKEIADYLDQKCAEIDTLIEKKTALLEEMEALKKSIIFEYVTGKKEVASATEEVVAVVYPYFPSVLPTSKPRFAQAVLMSKILDSNVSNMGRVKLEKMLFTIEHSLGFDFDTEYHREAAGPLDSSIYECERVVSQRNKWFYVNSSDYGVSYKARKDRSKYKKYYEQYFSDYNEEIERIITIFRTYTLDQAEIVATLYGAWNDMIIDKRDFTDEDVADEVLNHWNESKKRFSKDVWLRAMETMRKNNLVPKGYGKHTIVKEKV